MVLKSNDKCPLQRQKGRHREDIHVKMEAQIEVMLPRSPRAPVDPEAEEAGRIPRKPQRERGPASP